MTDKREYRDIASNQQDDDARRFDRERIMLALVGLAGAIAILVMNTRF